MKNTTWIKNHVKNEMNVVIAMDQEQHHFIISINARYVKELAKCERFIHANSKKRTTMKENRTFIEKYDGEYNDLPDCPNGCDKMLPESNGGHDQWHECPQCQTVHEDFIYDKKEQP